MSVKILAYNGLFKSVLSSGHANLDSEYGPYLSLYTCLKDGVPVYHDVITGVYTGPRAIGLTVGIYTYTADETETPAAGHYYKDIKILTDVRSGNQYPYDDYVEWTGGEATGDTTYHISGIKEYWFKAGTHDYELVEKIDIDDVGVSSIDNKTGEFSTGLGVTTGTGSEDKQIRIKLDDSTTKKEGTSSGLAVDSNGLKIDESIIWHLMCGSSKEPL